MYALRERRVHVTQEDFEMAVAKIMQKDTEKNMSIKNLKRSFSSQLPRKNESKHREIQNYGFRARAREAPKVSLSFGNLKISILKPGLGKC